MYSSPSTKPCDLGDPQHGFVGVNSLCGVLASLGWSRYIAYATQIPRSMPTLRYCLREQREEGEYG